MGIKVKEYPIFWIPGEGTKVNIIKTPVEMLSGIIRIKINDLEGKYILK